MPAVDWRAFGERVLDFLFTPRCVGCQREGSYLCGPCLDGARPLDVAYNPDTAMAGALPAEPGALEGVVSCFVMEGTTREAVHHLKYRGLRAIAQVMGTLMAERARRSGVVADTVVPVPLHRKRLRERGYNQAELLARHVANGLDLPADAEAAQRVSHGTPQARSSGVDDRWAAVQGAFEAARRLDGRRVLLVDDVYTTGATLETCGRALKDAGAVSVWGLTFAREL